MLSRGGRRQCEMIHDRSLERDSLQSRIIATTGQLVGYETGGQSSETFHKAPDGAAVFNDITTGVLDLCVQCRKQFSWRCWSYIF